MENKEQFKQEKREILDYIWPNVKGLTQKEKNNIRKEIYFSQDEIFLEIAIQNIKQKFQAVKVNNSEEILKSKYNPPTDLELWNKEYILKQVKKDSKESENKIYKKDIRKEALILIDNNDTSGACYIIAEYFTEKYSLITFADTEEIYIYMGGVYIPRGIEILKKEIQNVLQDYCKLYLVNEILGHVKRWTLKNRTEIKEPIDKICLLNGVLNLDDLAILEHSPDLFFFNKIPVRYVKELNCPKIEKFLKQIVKEGDIQLLQEFAGYCLYKDYFIHKAFMLVGVGANGKSTFLNLMKFFLERLSHNRFSISSIFGKLANVFADLSSQALRETSIFKMLVGQDLVPAEKKFKDEFFFVNYGKLIFSTNQIPKSPEYTDAFFRRWIIINFPNQFLQNANKKIIKELTTSEELSGFLNFALEGLRRLLTNSDFSATKSIEETREQYIRMSDSVGAFIMDKIEISPENYEIKKKLYTAYSDYCREKSYPIESENIFHKELQKKIRIEDYRPSVQINGKLERPPAWNGIKLNINTKNSLDNADNHDTNNGNVNPVNDVKAKNHLKNSSDKQVIQKTIEEQQILCKFCGEAYNSEDIKEDVCRFCSEDKSNK